jgi:uncharacterized protein YcgI (DUF1989 family)
MTMANEDWPDWPGLFVRPQEPDHTQEWAPRPWRVASPNKQYMQIVDANGNPVCDFFPFARKGGRGWQQTEAIAQQIVVRANSATANPATG